MNGPEPFQKQWVGSYLGLNPLLGITGGFVSLTFKVAGDPDVEVNSQEQEPEWQHGCLGLAPPTTLAFGPFGFL